MNFHECVRIAYRDFPNRSTDSWLHWSFILQRGKIIEWGINRQGEPSALYKAGYKTGRHSIHAEAVALSKAMGKMDKRKPWTLVNIRLNALKELTMSAPCPLCTSFIRSCGCHQIFYSDPYGRFVKLMK